MEASNVQAAITASLPTLRPGIEVELADMPAARSAYQTQEELSVPVFGLLTEVILVLTTYFE